MKPLIDDFHVHTSRALFERLERAADHMRIQADGADLPTDGDEPHIVRSEN